MTRLKNILSAALISGSCLYGIDPIVNYHSFLWGMYTIAKGSPVDATSFFEMILLDETSSLVITKLYILYAYQAKQYAFVAHKQSFIKHYCCDTAEYPLMLARSLEHIQKNSEAGEWYAYLEKNYFNDADVLYHVIRSHIRAHRLTRALECAERFIRDTPQHHACAVFYYIQAQLHQIVGNNDAALLALQQCITASPTFEQGWFLWGVLHENMHNILEAQKGYTQFLTVAGSDKTIEKKVMSLVLQERHQAGTSWYDRAIQAFHAQEFQKALLLLSVAQQEQPHSNQCSVLQMQIFDILKRPDDLCRTCKEFLLKNMNHEEWLRIVHTLFLHTIYKNELLTVFDGIITEKKYNQKIILYALDCALRLDDYQKVMRYYKKLIVRKKDTFLQALVLYHVGTCAYEHQDIMFVRHIAEQVYKQKYAYAPLLNFSAYYYNKYEKDYTKAQELITRALRYEPDNPHFQDTQACIYLNTGEKQKAAHLLQNLVHQVPLDRTIRHHRRKSIL